MVALVFLGSHVVVWLVWCRAGRCELPTLVEKAADRAMSGKERRHRAELGVPELRVASARRAFLRAVRRIQRGDDTDGVGFSHHRARLGRGERTVARGIDRADWECSMDRANGCDSPRPPAAHRRSRRAAASGRRSLVDRRHCRRRRAVHRERVATQRARGRGAQREPPSADVAVKARQGRAKVGGTGWGGGRGRGRRLMDDDARPRRERRRVVAVGLCCALFGGVVRGEQETRAVRTALEILEARARGGAGGALVAMGGTQQTQTRGSTCRIVNMNYSQFMTILVACVVHAISSQKPAKFPMSAARHEKGSKIPPCIPLAHVASEPRLQHRSHLSESAARSSQATERLVDRFDHGGVLRRRPAECSRPVQRSCRGTCHSCLMSCASGWSSPHRIQ